MSYQRGGGGPQYAYVDAGPASYGIAVPAAAYRMGAAPPPPPSAWDGNRRYIAGGSNGWDRRPLQVAATAWDDDLTLRAAQNAPGRTDDRNFTQSRVIMTQHAGRWAPHGLDVSYTFPPQPSAQPTYDGWAGVAPPAAPTGVIPHYGVSSKRRNSITHDAAESQEEKHERIRARMQSTLNGDVVRVVISDRRHEAAGGLVQPDPSAASPVIDLTEEDEESTTDGHLARIVIKERGATSAVSIPPGPSRRAHGQHLAAGEDQRLRYHPEKHRNYPNAQPPAPVQGQNWRAAPGHRVIERNGPVAGHIEPKMGGGIAVNPKFLARRMQQQQPDVVGVSAPSASIATVAAPAPAARPIKRPTLARHNSNGSSTSTTAVNESSPQNQSAKQSALPNPLPQIPSPPPQPLPSATQPILFNSSNLHATALSSGTSRSFKVTDHPWKIQSDRKIVPKSRPETTPTIPRPSPVTETLPDGKRQRIMFSEAWISPVSTHRSFRSLPKALVFVHSLAFAALPSIYTHTEIASHLHPLLSFLGRTTCGTLCACGYDFKMTSTPNCQMKPRGR
ncbi:hypothetical protein DFJ77DRAFT_294250 [Powellomyces hirtus]|nr:hypothetical protein DFJ77DRAFT_294250 [Powellomyces hirtus]